MPPSEGRTDRRGWRGRAARRRKSIGGPGRFSASWSCSLELRRALAAERLHPFQEISGGGHLLLDRRLELELIVESGVHPRVELALGSRVGGGRPGGQALGQRVDLRLEHVV